LENFANMVGARMLSAKEARRRQIQKEAAMAPRERAENEMRKKTLIQGNKMLEDHVRKVVSGYVPAACRKVAGSFPPKLYYRFWATVIWLLYQPAKVLGLVVSMVFIRPCVWFQRWMWKFGCYTEIKKIDEWRLTIDVHRWFTLKYRCRFDLRNGNVDQVETDEGPEAVG